MANATKKDTEKYEDLEEEKDEDLEVKWMQRRRSTKKYVYACALFASLNSILLGYDGGVMSGAILYIQRDLSITEFQVEILVGCISVISLIGSLSGGRTSDAMGRKWTMGLGAIVFQSGVIIMTFAPSFTYLMIGRLIAGVGMGFCGMISGVYIAEISPAGARGTLTSFIEISINLGILLGYVSNYAFSGISEHINWRIMLGVGVLPSVFIGIALFIIPESPRWLVMENRLEEAQAVLVKLSETDIEVEQRMEEIKEAAGVSKD
ncbi:polyol transporter 4 [Carex littledalei]|uniref:Polyol transporter 4 n=1 Tax=Carex littledalei TaxID=544730 RepID=A0A833RV11_9POAL|nr:polyol transporter 4 [Carex littledalei]